MRAGRRRVLLAGIAALSVLLVGIVPPGAVFAARSPHTRGERVQQAANIDVDIIGDPIIGRPIEVEVGAANPTGFANQGSITVSLPGNPTIEIVGASAQGARIYRPGEPMFNFRQASAVPITVPAVELFVNPWPAGTRHSLRLRLTARTPYSIQARATFRRTDGQFVNIPGNGQLDQQGAPTRLIDIAPRQPVPPTAPPKPTTPPPPTHTAVPPTNTPVPPTATTVPEEKPAQPPPAQKPPAEKPTAAPTTAPDQPAGQVAKPTSPPAPTAPPMPASAPADGPSMPLLFAGFGIMAIGLGVALLALLIVLRRRSEPTGHGPSPYAGASYPPPTQPYGGGPTSGPYGGQGVGHSGPGYPGDFGVPPAGAPPAPPPWGTHTPQPGPGWPGGHTVPSQTPAPPSVPPWERPAGSPYASPPPHNVSGTPPPPWATPYPQSGSGLPPGHADGGTPVPPGQGSGAGVAPAAERYVDRQLVGRGGMGSVYKAYDSRLHRWVALKIMHADLRSQPGFLERFIREAQVAAMLDHPNIVTMYDIEPVGDSIHMVMAWIEGEDLQRIVEREGALPLDRTARLLDQVASALDHAHRATPPVLHRDIKPSNIMVGPGDRAILTDFGIARLVGDVGLTQVGQMVGTPAYMAPEVVRGEEADGRADVYALGVVLFQMVTGRTPFKAETPLALLHQQVHTPPPLPRTVAPQLPMGLDGVLMRALAKDREQRFQTAGALARAYRAAAGVL